MNTTLDDDIRTLNVAGTFGRDIGKTFFITEIAPYDQASLILRLVSALQVPSFEDVMDKLQSNDGGAPIEAIMGVLRGANPQAVHALIMDILGTVQIAPDPKHPGAKRALMDSDIRELRTLGEILMGAFKLNFASLA
jgi:hypothetical protein